ncbi:uncharacterized protein C8A04DRAFT_32306 [Dichotomopilus funicola]|uniref:Uncharacterized protein n=1 Tax=Dichotomopilus funicola TaxID=1934379 RepID=A0AAN6ZI83_9PEZI|nr:hypothetical protein C8A04DRAFT_32306 [Dichotomopilus funicola]
MPRDSKTSSKGPSKSSSSAPGERRPTPPSSQETHLNITINLLRTLHTIRESATLPTTATQASPNTAGAGAAGFDYFANVYHEPSADDMPSMSIRTVSDDGLSEVQTSDDLLRVVHAVTKLVLDMLEAPGSAAVENLAQLGADVVQQWRWTPPAHDIIYPPAPPVRPGQPSQLRPTDGEMRGWVSFFVGHLRQNFVPVVLSQHLANEQYYGDYAYAEFPRADWATDSMARCNQQAWATGRSLTSQELQEVMRDWEPWRAGCMVIKLEMLESLAELRSAYLNTPNSHPKYSKRAEVYRTTLTFQAIMAIHELVHCFVGFLGGWGPRVLTPVSIIPPQYTACLRETEDPIVTAGCTPRGEAGRTWEDRVLGGIASLCYLPTNPGDVPVAQLLITDSNNRTRLVNPKAVERFVKRDFKFPLDIIGDWAAPVGYTALRLFSARHPQDLSNWQSWRWPFSWLQARFQFTLEKHGQPSLLAWQEDPRDCSC